MEKRISVKAPGGGYEVMIGPGLLRRFHDLVAEFCPGEKIVVVSNPTVASLYARALAVGQTEPLLIGDGEKYKTPDTVRALYDGFVAAGLDRDGTVVALGGGVVGDTTGFAAATYMRGVRLIHVPTTLLAMVDSCIGGKVGVDLPQGKNLVGAFKQPHLVVIDIDVLRTLPDMYWRCGLSEVIKHGLLADPGLIEPELYSLDRASELVERAIAVKMKIVEIDPLEQGVREHLNLGHTFAHAIEKAADYRWQHGEAVAIGLLAAARLSRALSLCDDSLPAAVSAALTSARLPTRLSEIQPDAICAAMSTDKKKRRGRVRLVLLKGIGNPIIVEDVPRDALIKILESLL